MKTHDIVKFLSFLGMNNANVGKRTGWVLSGCPLGPWRHDNGKSNPEAFGIKIESGDAFANCMSCGWHGSQADLVIEMRDQNRRQPRDKFAFGPALQLIAQAEEDEPVEVEMADFEDVLLGGKKTKTVFQDWWLASFLPWRESPISRDYLAARNVHPDVADYMDLRVDTVQKRVCAPVFDFEGDAVGLHGRAVENHVDPRYRMYTFMQKNNPIVWYGEHYVDRTLPIVVTEGFFDVASVLRVYPNAVSPLFANPSYEKLRRMADALEWVTMLDRGKAGDIGRARIEAALPDHVIHHVLLPDGVKDPGEASEDLLRDLLKNLVSLP